MQGGARLTTTTSRVDWGVSVYRGFRSFPTSTLEMESAGATSLAAPIVFETFPRFTMVGADFETVRGAWGLRGEVATFVNDELQSVRGARGVPGRSVEAGVGVDRRAGEYRLAANVLWSWRGVDSSDPVGRLFDGDPEVEGTDGMFVVAADRSFARETRTLRAFSAYDPGDGTLFSRVIGAVSVAENVWVEGSAGLFAGSAPDTLGRLTNRDFVSTRLKVSF